MKQSMPNEAGPILEVLEQNLGESIAGAYLFGSATMGGLRPRSDVDILVAVRRSLDERTRLRLAQDMLSVSGEAVANGPTRPAEVTVVTLDDVVPWRYPARREFQYGEWLRDDVTAGKPLQPALDADLAVLLTLVMQSSKPLLGPDASTLFDPVPSADLYRALLDVAAELVHGWRGDERNAVLALARIWITLETGEIVPKDVAARRLMDRVPQQHKDVLKLACKEYLGEHEEDWASRDEEVRAFVCYAEEGIGRISAASTRIAPCRTC